MKKQEWISRWEKRVPLGLQESWDHSGKQFGRFTEELTGVVFCLDLTQEAIDQAKEMGANLIFTHHPVLFDAVHGLDEEVELHDLVMQAIALGIAVYSSHTAFDTVDGGVNHVLAELADLSDVKPLRPRDAEDALFSYAKGFGTWGVVSPQKLAAYAKRLKEAFQAESVVFYGDPDRVVTRVACLGGAGVEFAEDAVAAGCDVLLTADVKYHEAQDVVRKGLALIDLGHYASEFPAMERAREWAEEFAPEIPTAVVSNGPESVRYCV